MSLLFLIVCKFVKFTTIFTRAQARNLPLTRRLIEFNGRQHVTFITHRDNYLQLQVRSADKAERIVRVRENQVEEFIRAYEAGGTLKTKLIRTTNAKFVIEVRYVFPEPSHKRFEVCCIAVVKSINCYSHELHSIATEISIDATIQRAKSGLFEFICLLV